MGQLKIGGVDSIRDAQAWSALRKTQAEDTAKANAAAVDRFRARGLDLKVVDMVDGYKADMLKSTDVNRDDIVSLSELGKQLVGKSEEEIASIHDAMDVDKNGQVSAEEFRRSVPTEDYFAMVEAARAKGELMVRFDDSDRS